MIRTKCLRLGHDFREFEATRLPVVLCRRWLCDGAMVPAWVWRDAPATAAALDDIIRRKDLHA